MPRARILGLVVTIVVVLVAAALLFRPSNAAKQAAPSAPAVGHPAPQFALRDAAAKEIRLADQRGKVVLLNFWATWCVPCRNEMPAIEGVYASHKRELAVLAIDKDEPVGDVTAYGRKHGLTYPLVLDPNLIAWTRYGVRIQPVSFWIDRDGIIRAIHYGPMEPGFLERELHRLTA